MKEIIKLAGKSFISNFKALDFPMKVTLLLTLKCNAKCIMCNIWKKSDHSDELSTEEFAEFFKKSNNISWLDLGGGEIFLREDIMEIIKIIFTECKNLFLLHYATNGFMVERTINMTEKILSFNPRKLLVTVSLDGDKRLHEKIRGIQGCYDKTIKTFSELRRFNSKKFKVFLGMTLTDENSSKFQETFNSVKKVIPDITLEEFHLNIIQLSSHYYDNLDYKISGREKILKTIKDFEKKRGGSILNPINYLERRYQRLSGTFIKTGRCPLPCLAFSNSCFISSNGDVFPCTMYNNVVANIRDFNYDLKKLWNAPEVIDVRNEIQAGNCPQCWTPCEAYQTIIGNFFKVRKSVKNLI